MSVGSLKTPLADGMMMAAERPAPAAAKPRPAHDGPSFGDLVDASSKSAPAQDKPERPLAAATPELPEKSSRPAAAPSRRAAEGRVPAAPKSIGSEPADASEAAMPDAGAKADALVVTEDAAPEKGGAVPGEDVGKDEPVIAAQGAAPMIDALPTVPVAMPAAVLAPEPVALVVINASESSIDVDAVNAMASAPAQGAPAGLQPAMKLAQAAPTAGAAPIPEPPAGDTRPVGDAADAGRNMPTAAAQAATPAPMPLSREAVAVAPASDGVKSPSSAVPPPAAAPVAPGAAQPSDAPPPRQQAAGAAPVIAAHPEAAAATFAPPMANSQPMTDVQAPKEALFVEAKAAYPRDAAPVTQQVAHAAQTEGGAVKAPFAPEAAATAAAPQPQATPVEPAKADTNAVAAETLGAEPAPKAAVAKAPASPAPVQAAAAPTIEALSPPRAPAAAALPQSVPGDAAVDGAEGAKPASAPGARAAPASRESASHAADFLPPQSPQAPVPQPHQAPSPVSFAAEIQAKVNAQLQAPAGHHAITIDQVPVTIAARAAQGNTQFDIRLDPAELGRIDVKMQVDREGYIKTHMVVESRETYELLQRDQRQLERVLGQSGFKASEGAIEFSLRQDTGGQQRQTPAQNDTQGQNGQGRPGAPGLFGGDDGLTRAQNDAAALHYARMAAKRGGIDIRI